MLSAIKKAVILILFSPLIFSVSALAQLDESRTISTIPLRAVEADSVSIEIDGELNESIWQSVEPIGEFATVEPDTLVPGQYPTLVRAIYTEKGVYVSFELHQPVETLVARLSSRDQRQINRDAVFITFDSSSEARYGYWFGIALGDSLMDGTILPERRYASNWDGPWWGATAVTDYGWSAEMYLPWSMMSMPQVDDVRNMGVYVSRKVAYLNERWAWPALPSTQPKFLSVLDRVQVQDVAPRQQYHIFPYASATVDEVADDTDYKAGADIFWRPSTDFQLSATLNPDFGTVEADDVIVNLSAFETFFPEKRLFFLEGQEIFIATPRASGSNPTTLLNTRRIGGLTELDGALKVTGETGAMRYGVLTAFEDDADSGVLGRDIAITRFLYEDSSAGAARGIGYMGTIAKNDNRDVYVHSFDGHYLNSTGQIQFDSQLIYTDIKDIDPARDAGSGVGGFADLRYTPKQGRNHLFAVDYFDENISIRDLGFFRRNDLINFRYIWQENRSDISFGRDVSMRLMIPLEWNNEWQATRQGMFWNADITRDNLSEVRLVFNWFPDRYEDRNSFGNGTYQIKKRGQISVGYSTDSSKPLVYSIDVRRDGEEFGGQNFSGDIGLTWRIADQATLETSVYHRVRDRWLLHSRQPGDTNMTTYDADEWRFRLSLDYFITARQQLRASMQWVGIKAEQAEYYQIPTDDGFLERQPILPTDPSRDFSISNLNLQLRYRWEIAPMSDLFVVYTKNGNIRGDNTDSFGGIFDEANDMPVAEQLVIKLRYRFGS